MRKVLRNLSEDIRIHNLTQSHESGIARNRVRFDVI